jgi:hypothetical protein
MIDTRNAVFVGWLHDEFDYRNAADPRVKALCTILCRAVRFATTTQRQVREAGWCQPLPAPS